MPLRAPCVALISSTTYLVIVLASVGLPLLNGFIGEFLVLSGAFQDKPVYGILGAVDMNPTTGAGAPS